MLRTREWNEDIVEWMVGYTPGLAFYEMAIQNDGAPDGGWIYSERDLLMVAKQFDREWGGDHLEHLERGLEERKNRGNK